MVREDMVDLALLIFLIGIVISIGLSLAIKTEKKAREVNSILEDKNIKEIKGYGIEDFGDFDGTLTKEDIALMIVVQDNNYVPKPNKIILQNNDGTKMTYYIYSSDSATLLNEGTAIYRFLKDEKYKLDFQDLSVMNPNEGSYTLVPVIN